jgi:hypothetical protein
MSISLCAVCPFHLSVPLSVHIENLGSGWTDFMKFGIGIFLEKLERKIKFN